MRHVDRRSSQVRDTDPDVQVLKRLLGAVGSQLEAVFYLRNQVGTGHGRAGTERRVDVVVLGGDRPALAVATRGRRRRPADRRVLPGRVTEAAAYDPAAHSGWSH